MENKIKDRRVFRLCDMRLEKSRIYGYFASLAFLVYVLKDMTFYDELYLDHMLSFTLTVPWFEAYESCELQQECNIYIPRL